MNYFKSHFSFPNVLTFLRILLTPVFVILLWQKYLLFAFLVFTFAAFTDLWDGFFARRLQQVSTFGAFLDPLADKVLVISAFGAFCFLGIIKLWIVLLIVLRDVVVTFLRFTASRGNGVMATSLFAKRKTALQIIAIYIIFAHLLLSPWGEISFWSGKAVDVAMYLVVGLTVYSGFVYLSKNRKFLKDISWARLFLETVASFFGLGYIPPCPGTFASAAVAIIFFFTPAVSSLLFLLFLVSLFFSGVWISKKVAAASKQRDPSKIVIDEVVGMLIALFMVPKNAGFYILSFGIFRFFDVVKIFPINKIEKLPRGWGVMLDDVVAGIFTLACVSLVKMLVF